MTKLHIASREAISTLDGGKYIKTKGKSNTIAHQHVSTTQ
jgi:hypothetical protein